jgi:hypothetical protein
MMSHEDMQIFVRGFTLGAIVIGIIASYMFTRNAK